MKTTLLAIAAMTGIAGFAPSVFAQDDPKPVVIGDFDNSGSVTAGYRLTSVAGYQPMFQQLFDMNSGFRVMDFSLFGRARDGTTPFADSYSLVVSGLGGDPFTTAQLTVKKKNLYDLRVDFRQSHYYFNENDAAALPNALDGLTSNHNWATVRKMGSIDLLIHATNNLRFSFEYNRNTRDGVTDTTQTFDFFRVAIFVREFRASQSLLSDRACQRCFESGDGRRRLHAEVLVAALQDRNAEFSGIDQWRQRFDWRNEASMWTIRSQPANFSPREPGRITDA